MAVIEARAAPPHRPGMLAAADGARLRRRPFAGIKVAKTAFLSTREEGVGQWKENSDP